MEDLNRTEHKQKTTQTWFECSMATQNWAQLAWLVNSITGENKKLSKKNLFKSKRIVGEKGKER